MTDFPDNPFTAQAEHSHKVILCLVMELFSTCISHAISVSLDKGLTRDHLTTIGNLTNFAVQNFGGKTPETLTVGEAYDIAINCKTEGRAYLMEVDNLIISMGGNDGDITATEVLDDFIALLA